MRIENILLEVIGLTFLFIVLWLMCFIPIALLSFTFQATKLTSTLEEIDTFFSQLHPKLKEVLERKNRLSNIYFRYVIDANLPTLLRNLENYPKPSEARLQIAYHSIVPIMVIVGGIHGLFEVSRHGAFYVMTRGSLQIMVVISFLIVLRFGRKLTRIRDASQRSST
jgi:hypothetical protein